MPRLDLFEISESHLSSSRLDSIFAQNPAFDVVIPLKSVNNDENQTKTGSEEEDMVTSDEENEKEIRTDPTYTSTTTVEAHDKRMTRSTKDPSTPHCALISKYST